MEKLDTLGAWLRQRRTDLGLTTIEVAARIARSSGNPKMNDKRTAARRMSDMERVGRVARWMLPHVATALEIRRGSVLEKELYRQAGLPLAPRVSRRDAAA